MPRPNREAEIRRAALRCFSRLGYDATRVRHIAAEAGVSDAALYAHWKGKEELAATIFAEGMTAYGQTISAIAAESDTTVEARLRAIARASLELYRTDADALTFLIQGQGRFLAALDAGFAYPIHVVERLVAEGQADGSVRDGDARVLAATAMGCFTYPVIVAIYARAGTIDPASEHDLIADATWAAVRTRAR
jgi:AcrR family transcriptional regulator